MFGAGYLMSNAGDKACTWCKIVQEKIYPMLFIASCDIHKENCSLESRIHVLQENKIVVMS